MQSVFSRGFCIERYKRYLKNGSPIQIQRQYAIRPESGSTKYNSTLMTCRLFQGNSWRWWRRWRTSCTRTLPRRRSSRARYCTLTASLLHNYCLLTAIITSTLRTCWTQRRRGLWWTCCAVRGASTSARRAAGSTTWGPPPTGTHPSPSPTTTHARWVSVWEWSGKSQVSCYCIVLLEISTYPMILTESNKLIRMSWIVAEA